MFKNSKTPSSKTKKLRTNNAFKKLLWIRTNDGMTLCCFYILAPFYHELVGLLPVEKERF